MPMKKTRVVHCRRTESDVFIGRPGSWGNPFEINAHGTRSEVIEKYRLWIVTQPHLMARLRELKGKRLGCYCRPQRCHGDVLAAMADALPEVG